MSGSTMRVTVRTTQKNLVALSFFTLLLVIQQQQVLSQQHVDARADLQFKQGRMLEGSSSNTTSSLFLKEIEMYKLEAFPRDKVALHFSCAESELFATNCACHVRCRGGGCDNAKKICAKYRASSGCKYVLLRGGAKNKFATLKREPTAIEQGHFSTDKYPKTDLALKEWMQQQGFSLDNGNTSKTKTGPLVSDYSTSKGIALKLQERRGSKHCHPITSGKGKGDNVKADKLQGGIALVVVSYRAPLTLTNSMQTWSDSGLLDMVHERVIILNDPVPEEIALSLAHGFRVLQPKDIAPPSRMSKANVLTIGAAFYYGFQQIKGEYMLFLENDFVMDTSLDKITTESILGGAASLLDKGMQIIRLQSRKGSGCGTHKDCLHHGIHLDSANPSERVRNWFSFYCRTKNDETDVSDCLYDPSFRCFTSWDSNWSLNAVMVKKSDMLRIKYTKEEKDGEKGQMLSIPEIGLSQWEKNDGFETTMIFALKWMKWRVPMCIAYDGLFLHQEIETST